MDTQRAFRKIAVPSRVTSKNLPLVAMDICRAVREEYSLMNCVDVPYEAYEDFVDATIEESGIAKVLKTDEALEDFQLLCADLWPESSSGNLYKLGMAVERFRQDEMACTDPRLKKPKLRRAATFLICLALAHGGRDSEFYISVRKLAEVLDISKNTAQTLLSVLRDTYKFIVLVKRSERKDRLASIYRLGPKITRTGTHGI